MACTDASPFGLGVVRRKLSQVQVQEIGRQKERFRFKIEGGAQARQRALEEVGVDEETAMILEREEGFVWAESDDRPDPDSEGFSEVPKRLLRPGCWSSVSATHVEMGPNILSLEGEALVAGFRNILRSCTAHGRRILVFSGNLPLVLATGKGRAKSVHLRQALYRVCVCVCSIAGHHGLETRRPVDPVRA